MKVSNRKEAGLLLLGDVVIFVASLWLTLAMRYLVVPSQELFFLHFWPFFILFGVWIIVFFISGLYEKHTLFFKSLLPVRVLYAQGSNVVIALFFFHLIPYFGITPKTNLFIYLIVSCALILLWRLHGHRLIATGKREKALLIGSGVEMKDLEEEIGENSRYGIDIASVIDLESIDNSVFHTEIINRVYSAGISIIIIDIRNDKVQPLLPHLYKLMFSRIKFIDLHTAYEEIFDRIPLSLVRDSWFLENVSLHSKTLYDGVKRGMDIVLATILSLFSLPFVLLACVAIKLEDGGKLFIVHERLGKDNRLIKIIKLRTMSRDEKGKTLTEKTDNVVTRTGDFLRRSRIDELPQLWNILKGDLSLIGPRPEFPELAKIYEEQVPYYNVRHLIKPGVTGWAQIYHKDAAHFEAGTESTKVKLSYDLYYLKNRSILADIKITLRTIMTVLSRSGI